MKGYAIQLMHLLDRPVLVVGGGPVAAQKAGPLLEAGAKVTVVALHVSADMKALEPRLEVVKLRPAELFDLNGVELVIAASSDTALNRRLAAEARRRRILVNVADDPGHCDFYSPAVVRRGRLNISFSTDGASPLLSAQVRRLFEAAIPRSLESLSEFFATARTRGLKGLARRGRLLSALADSKVTRLVDQGDFDAAYTRLEHVTSEEEEPFEAGTVAIVGAGPGSRSLLTIRALDRLQRADVILHDALVEQEVLDLAMPNTEVINVGRRAERGDGAKKRFPQALTERLMVEHARRGSRVVRLHAGDAMVFGRGGEEIATLRGKGIAFELVPGVSSVLAAPAAANIPLTMRGVSRGFSVRTGHTRQGYSRGELPAHEETVVVLMGLGAVQEIARGLISEGRPAATPAAAVSNASRESQRVVVADLATLADAVAAAGLEGPATLIVGEVVTHASAPALGEIAATQAA